MSQSRTYDPLSVICTFAGIHISGYADGTFVKAERDTDTFTKLVGASGETARARSRNKGGKVTFTLMASSPVNDLLSAQAALDELTGLGVGTLMIKDFGGTTLHLANAAWIQKPAASEFGKEIGTREWIIDCESLSMTVGGTTALVID